MAISLAINATITIAIGVIMLRYRSRYGMLSKCSAIAPASAPENIWYHAIIDALLGLSRKKKARQTGSPNRITKK